jgi:hypothetical protein
MNPEMIQYQKYFLVRVFDKPIHKSNQCLRVHLVFINHKPDLALVGHCWDQIYTLASWVYFYGWCFPAGGITSAMIAVITKTCLIAPVDFSLFFFRFYGNGRVFFFLPSRYCLWVLSIGFAQWFLRGVIPSFQIFAHCPYGHFDWKKFLYELLTGNPCP